jgi:hypothetical protein
MIKYLDIRYTTMSTYKDHSYYTHQPFFIEVLKHTSGNILECGCGDGSTLMIKKQIKDTSRQLVSLESNLEWLNKYMHLADSNHKLYHVEASSDDTDFVGNQWIEFIKKNNLNDFEVVFLDSCPWLSRKHCFDYFKDKAKIIIIHDFDYFPLYNIIGKVTTDERIDGKRIISCDLTGVVKNYKLFHPPLEYFAGETGPPTLICSDSMDTEEFNNLIATIETNKSNYY